MSVRQRQKQTVEASGDVEVSVEQEQVSRRADGSPSGRGFKRGSRESHHSVGPIEDSAPEVPVVSGDDVTERIEEHREVFVPVGLAGAGKSTVADIIEEEFEERVVTFEVSDFVRTMYQGPEGPDESVTDNELGAWAAEQKEKNGQDYFVREMAKTIKSPSTPHVVISGVRSPEEAVAVEDVFGAENVTVISVWTLPDLRFERKYGDSPSEEHPKYDEFCERNERETFEWGCVEFFMPDGPQDYIVTNNGSEAALEVDLNAIVDHEVYGHEMPEQWREDWYPFPDGLDREQVAQYL